MKSRRMRSFFFSNDLTSESGVHTMTRLKLATFIGITALAGCQFSDLGGGPTDNTFRILVPALTVELTQGLNETVDISLQRGDSFKQDVLIEIDAPEGVDVDPDF